MKIYKIIYKKYLKNIENNRFSMYYEKIYKINKKKNLFLYKIYIVFYTKIKYNFYNRTARAVKQKIKKIGIRKWR